MRKIVVAIISILFVSMLAGCSTDSDRGASYKEANAIAKDVKKITNRKFVYNHYDSERQFDRFTVDIYSFRYDDSSGNAIALTIYYNMNTDEILHITFAVLGDIVDDDRIEQVIELLLQTIDVECDIETVMDDQNNSIDSDGYNIWHSTTDPDFYFTISLIEYMEAGAAAAQ